MKKAVERTNKPNPKDRFFLTLRFSEFFYWINNCARFDELEREITEREQFLADMAKVGQKGQKYDAIIRGEIASLIREMEKIDMERDRALGRRLAAQKRKNAQLIWFCFCTFIFR